MVNQILIVSASVLAELCVHNNFYWRVSINIIDV
jgi:hypothetical protein